MSAPAAGATDAGDDAAQAPQRMRIDELAQRSGIASGTIRFYQREGLIAPPEREGRVAYYSEGHLDRLGRVRALQAQGLPLALVGDLLAREDRGADISGWLALDTALFARAPKAEPVDPGALAALGLTGPDIEALKDGGVLRRGEHGGLAALPGMLELITRLVDAGIGPAEIRAGAGLIATRLTEIADAMANLGWEAFAAEREGIAESDEQAAGEALEKLEHLRSLAHRIVATHFAALLDEAIGARAAGFADEHAQRLAARRVAT